jgi:hypothetical protein
MQVDVEPPAHSKIYSVLLSKVEVVSGQAVSSDDVDEVSAIAAKPTVAESR